MVDGGTVRTLEHIGHKFFAPVSCMTRALRRFVIRIYWSPVFPPYTISRSWGGIPPRFAPGSGIPLGLTVSSHDAAFEPRPVADFRTPLCPVDCPVKAR